MRRELPALEGVPLAPTNLNNIRTKREYGTVVRVRLTCILPVLLIEVYQKFTVDKPHVCNHYPSCSEYGRLAYIRYGFVAASFLTWERLNNCNAFSSWPRRNKP